MSKSVYKIGTRGSQLALYQANKVKAELEEKYPHDTFEIEIIKTKGDKILDTALSKIGDKGLFTREIEEALLNKSVDMAVHSLKDLPTVLPDGLIIGGVLKRGETYDALVSKNGKKLDDLNETDVIATSSLRRRAQLLAINSKFRIIDIRGNVNTRLRKMDEGYCDAIIMATAGLQRLELNDRITEIIDPDKIVPAVSQGAIAVEIRDNDNEIKKMVDGINHENTLLTVKAERVFLNKLEGGCQVPVGCYSNINGNAYQITGFISNVDGTGVLKDTYAGSILDAENIAMNLADLFLNKGARSILENIRNSGY